MDLLSITAVGREWWLRGCDAIDESGNPHSEFAYKALFQVVAVLFRGLNGRSMRMVTYLQATVAARSEALIELQG